MLARVAAAETVAATNELGAFRGYALSVEAREHFASRSVSPRPLLLFQQRVARVIASELQARVKLELALRASLRLELTLPFSRRSADVRFASLRVSEAQELS